MYVSSNFYVQFQSYYLIIDDIEDEALTRNGKPCWHLLPNVGNLALNDTSMMRSFIYELLRQNLSDEMYIKMCKLFNEVCVIVELIH